MSRLGVCYLDLVQTVLANPGSSGFSDQYLGLFFLFIVLNPSAIGEKRPS